MSEPEQQPWGGIGVVASDGNKTIVATEKMCRTLNRSMYP